MRNLLALSLLGVMMIFLSCASDASMDDDFVSFAAEYIEGYLEVNPEAATQLGDHRFDHRLDDYSVAGVEDKLAFNKSALRDMKKIKPQRLNTDNSIDYQILRNHIEMNVFRLETLKEHDWNPLAYNVGGAIYSLIARDFDSPKARMQSVRKRLEMVPEVAALAKANLKTPPRIHTETAALQNEGTVGLIRDLLTAVFEDVPGYEEELKPAQEKAVAALEYYGEWLKRDLLPESNGDFRIGKDKFRRKLRYVLDSDMSMEDILARAETDLVDTQQAMFETAQALYGEHFPGRDPRSLDKKTVIKAVLDKLADKHPANETIVATAGECLEECIEFTVANKLVTVPDEPIDLIVMPEFQRGVAVAYCDAPGPLEPAGKTFFAISPTPEDWTPERVTSFFREYNDYMLHDLTIHEAVPGHYLQLTHSNRFKAPTMVRSVFYSGPFVEGWATYTEQLMAEQGYGGPDVKMQQLKMRLRMIINAIIDQKIHTAGMTEEEAMDLMINEGFQEEGEASGKWRRACMTSTQLSTYYVGNIEVTDIRRDYERTNGKGMSLLEIHDKMLSFGSPPPRHVRRLMGI
jgi:uncharacterized protein (DUF885 family)